LALLQVSAAEYNGICKGLEDAISKLQSYHDISIFSKTVLIPTQVNNSSKMVEYPESEIEQFVNSYSCFSVEYGIAVPHYALDEIETLIIKKFYGCKYVQEDNEAYSIINFVGELRSCITDIRESYDQVTLEQAGQKDAVNDYILKVITKNRDVFYKVMKNVQGSLENIMIYYKNSRPKKITIGEFVSSQKIQGIGE